MCSLKGICLIELIEHIEYAFQYRRLLIVLGGSTQPWGLCPTPGGSAGRSAQPRGSASGGSACGGVCPTPPQVCLQEGGWADRMTHRCKNITLPQTSFVGGKYWFELMENPNMFTVKRERKTKVVQIPDKMNDQTAAENKVVADGFQLCQQRNREEMRTH